MPLRCPLHPMPAPAAPGRSAANIIAWSTSRSSVGRLEKCLLVAVDELFAVRKLGDRPLGDRHPADAWLASSFELDRVESPFEGGLLAG